MKKLILLPLFLLTLFTSCSTDEADVQLQEESSLDYAGKGKIPTPSCFTSFTGFVEVDVTNGLQNPIIGFVADTEGGSATTRFTFVVEFQPLSECEDMDSAVGKSILVKVPYGVYNPDVNMPIVNLTPAQLPSGCYKWRYGAEASGGDCLSTSEWYDAPLF